MANVYNDVLLRDQGMLDQKTLDYVGGFLATAIQCKGGAVWWRIWPVPEDVRQYVASYVAAHASDLVSQEEIFPFWVQPWNEIESN